MINYVTIKGKKFKVKKSRLKINYKLIYDLSEINGLDSLTELEELNLNSNFEISEIKGIENLTNLKLLSLRNNRVKEINGLGNLINLRMLDLAKNNISEIKGLETLKNLEYLDLTGNKISEIKNLDKLEKLKILFIGRNLISNSFINNLGGITQKGEANYPQLFVEYSREIKMKFNEKKPALYCPFCGISVQSLNDEINICSNCGSKYEKKDLKELNEPDPIKKSQLKEITRNSG